MPYLGAGDPSLKGGVPQHLNPTLPETRKAANLKGFNKWGKWLWWTPCFLFPFSHQQPKMPPLSRQGKNSWPHKFRRRKRDAYRQRQNFLLKKESLGGFLLTSNLTTKKYHTLSGSTRLQRFSKLNNNTIYEERRAAWSEMGERAGRGALRMRRSGICVRMVIVYRLKKDRFCTGGALIGNGEGKGSVGWVASSRRESRWQKLEERGVERCPTEMDS